MQPVLSNPLTKLLQTAWEEPIAISWEASERVITPLSEVNFAGRTYLPGRSERQKKAGGPKTIPAQTFVARVDEELKRWLAQGKISIPLPWVDFGQVQKSCERAFRPWPVCLPDDGRGAGLEEVFLRVQLRKFVQVFPWVRIEPGEIFVTSFAVIEALGFDLERPGLAPLLILP
jgi:hypothetical protein